MKNRLLTLAGTLALLAVLGKYYAVPAIAQAVRAALVSNVDDPGRIPYQAALFIDIANRDCTGACFADVPAVPAGKRLVITHVSGTVITNVPGGSLLRPALAVGGGATVFFPATFTGAYGGRNHYTFGQATQLVYNAPNSPVPYVQLGAVSTTGSASVTLSGYMLDCTTAPCAAIAP